MVSSTEIAVGWDTHGRKEFSCFWALSIHIGFRIDIVTALVSAPVRRELDHRGDGRIWYWYEMKDFVQPWFVVWYDMSSVHMICTVCASSRVC